MKVAAKKQHKKYNIMIGPCLSGAGGIASVLNQYNTSGFFSALNIVFWPSWQPGSAQSKVSSTIKTAFKLLLWTISNKINLLHIHSATNISFFRKSIFAFIGIVFGLPVIFHIHSGKFFQDYRTRSPLYKKWVEFILNRSTAVVVLSQLWADEAAAILKRGDTIYILPNPIDLALPVDFKRAERQPNKLRLLFLGGLTTAKGFFDLIHALSQLQKKGLNVELRCGGNGDLEKIKVLLKEHQLENAVTLLGWINAVQKIQEFEAADLFVLPSHFEGQPMSILEAMQAGLLVLSTSVGGIPDIVQHERTGLLVPPDNIAALAAQIEHVYLNPELCESLVPAAQKYVLTTHAPDAILIKLQDIYNNL